MSLRVLPVLLEKIWRSGYGALGSLFYQGGDGIEVEIPVPEDADTTQYHLVVDQDTLVPAWVEDTGGGAGPGSGVVGPVVVEYRDVAGQTYADRYTVASDPVSPTTIKRDDGTTDLSVSFTLDQARDVRFRFTGRAVRSSGNSPIRFYDNGAQIIPDLSIVSAGVPARWPGSGQVDGTNVQHWFNVEYVIELAAGSHVITVTHEASENTNAITWYERALTVQVLAESGTTAGGLDQDQAILASQIFGA